MRGVSSHIIDPSDRIQVEKGDFIGVYSPSQPSFSYGFLGGNKYNALTVYGLSEEEDYDGAVLNVTSYRHQLWNGRLAARATVLGIGLNLT